MADSTWGTRIYKYYGYTPYWEEVSVDRRQLCAADLYGTREQSTFSKRGGCGFFPGGPLTDTHVPHCAAVGIVEPRKRRVLS